MKTHTPKRDPMNYDQTMTMQGDTTKSAHILNYSKSLNGDFLKNHDKNQITLAILLRISFILKTSKVKKRHKRV